MNNSRRMKRMSRNRSKVAALNLTSLMDVFTILVFFLLVNSASTEVLDNPKEMELPASVVETKPRETVVIFVSQTEVTVQGERVALVEDILAADTPNVPAIGARLAEVDDAIIGLATRTVAASREVTILADKTVPFDVVKRVMSTCTSEGFEKISLAVIQKAPETARG